MNHRDHSRSLWDEVDFNTNQILTEPRGSRMVNSHRVTQGPRCSDIFTFKTTSYLAQVTWVTINVSIRGPLDGTIGFGRSTSQVVLRTGEHELESNEGRPWESQLETSGLNKQNFNVDALFIFERNRFCDNVIWKIVDGYKLMATLILVANVGGAIC